MMAGCVLHCTKIILQNESCSNPGQVLPSEHLFKNDDVPFDCPSQTFSCGRCEPTTFLSQSFSVDHDAITSSHLTDEKLISKIVQIKKVFNFILNFRNSWPTFQPGGATESVQGFSQLQADQKTVDLSKSSSLALFKILKHSDEPYRILNLAGFVLAQAAQQYWGISA